MGYADRVRESSKPNCWGNPNAYDPADAECQGCAYKHSCRNEADRSNDIRSSHINVRRRTHSRPRYERYGEEEERDPITVSPNDTVTSTKERAVDRFFKDATGGAMRGMFYEMYKFWTKYRIP